MYMSIYELAKEYKKKYPGTICFRIKKHAAVVEEYLNPDEEVLYVFCGQNNEKWNDLFSSSVIVLTNKRILIGQKRVLWGSYYTQITPDLYNDMKIYKGLFFGKIIIDTVKEEVVITNLDKNSLDEIETAISEFMMKEKKLYKKAEK